FTRAYSCEFVVSGAARPRACPGVAAMPAPREPEDRAISVVIEDKGDTINAPTSASDAPAPERPVPEPHESQDAPVKGLRERLRLPLMIGAPVIAGVVALYFYMARVGYES